MSGKSIRDRYVQPDADDDELLPENEDDELDSSRYQAFGGRPKGGSRRATTIMFIYQDGITEEVMAYNYVIRMLKTDSSEVTIFTTEGVFLIDGQNLDSLLHEYRREQLSIIRAYNADKYPDPPAANEPIVLSIQFHRSDVWDAFVKERDEERPPE